MILRGTYIKCVFFDAEIGQASFLVKPSDKIEQDKMLDNGLVKVVGRFCLQQKYMPLFLTATGRTVNTARNSPCMTHVKRHWVRRK